MIFILKKTLSLFLSALIFCLSFCACSGDKGNDAYIYFNVTDVPKTLDAQLAQTSEELLIVRNIYEGLLRKDNTGKIVNGVCESYKKDGRVYTFNLRKDAVYSDGTPLTAADFVFALRRAVKPETKAPFVSRLFSVKNAEYIYETGADEKNLGVTAVDNHTLKIELNCDDENFPLTLTTSICMPCNEKFFLKSAGKYGLEADCVLSNGSYALKKWNPDDFGIRLYKNEEYKGDFVAKNGAVFLSSHTDDTVKNLFSDASFDVAFVDNADIDSVLELDIKKVSFQNICWVMTLSYDISEAEREALLSAISPDVYKDKLPTGFYPADSIFPDVLNVGKVSSSQKAPYNLDYAKSLFSAVVKERPDKECPEYKLYYYGDKALSPAVKKMLGHLQKNLCAFVNIADVKNPEELRNELSAKTLPLSLFPVYAKSGDVGEYLKNFNISYNNDPSSVSDALFKDKTLVPFAFEDTNICYLSNIENLYCDSENGYIDFSFAIKK